MAKEELATETELQATKALPTESGPIYKPKSLSIDLVLKKNFPF